jgi:GxxExxY protein
MISQTYLETLSYKVIGCIFEVHRYLGPGLLESVYQACLMEELRLSEISAVEKPYVPIIYKNTLLGGKFQMDILIEDLLVLELKAVEAMIPLYKAQLITYL